MSILNIAAYKFVSLPQADLPVLQQSLQAKTAELGIKGTILLSTEGVNQFIAGEPQAIHDFRAFLQQIPAFADLVYKDSWSEAQPFVRMSVKLKAEIVAFHVPEIAPEVFTAPRISPQTLKEWYAQKRDMVVLDTRNTYEVHIGKFADAIHLNLRYFRHFPAAAQLLAETIKDKTIVTYCTGGIRCEKAAAWMLQAGFKDVYQLDGGILNYFEQCGGDYYEGECFVFDQRTAVDANLTAMNVPLCTQCQYPFTKAERARNSELCELCGDSMNL